MTSENTGSEAGNESTDHNSAGNDKSGNDVVVYGSATCPYTARARQWLAAWDVDYRWVDVDEDPAAEKQIAAWNGGRSIRPTLDIGGAIFVNPDQSVLRAELAARGLV